MSWPPTWPRRPSPSRASSTWWTVGRSRSDTMTGSLACPPSASPGSPRPRRTSGRAAQAGRSLATATGGCPGASPCRRDLCSGHPLGSRRKGVPHPTGDCPRDASQALCCWPSTTSFLYSTAGVSPVLGGFVLSRSGFFVVVGVFCGKSPLRYSLVRGNTGECFSQSVCHYFYQ